MIRRLLILRPRPLLRLKMLKKVAKLSNSISNKTASLTKELGVRLRKPFLVEATATIYPLGPWTNQAAVA